jgi:hypothetical protein
MFHAINHWYNVTDIRKEDSDNFSKYFFLVISELALDLNSISKWHFPTNRWCRSSFS